MRTTEHDMLVQQRRADDTTRGPTQVATNSAGCHLCSSASRQMFRKMIHLKMLIAVIYIRYITKDMNIYRM